MNARAVAFLKSSGYALSDLLEVFKRNGEGYYRGAGGPITPVRPSCLLLLHHCGGVLFLQ